ncbi:MAG: hypothetical protein U9P12_05710, partial [Verrucomicrobiota bacterium]|nr:hypothetical protein [Verrucomicrobiota bacterium]
MSGLKLWITAMLAVVAVATVRAETLALWENDNLVTATNSNPVDTFDPDVSASDLALGGGFTAPSTTWLNALDAGLGDAAGITNLAAAIADNRYYSFSVTPNAGKQASYSNIATRVTLNSLTNIGTSVSVVLMSSATGFTDGDEIGSFTASTPSTAATDNGLIDVDVSGVVALQDQPSEVEFRLYVVLTGTAHNRIALGHV